MTHLRRFLNLLRFAASALIRTGPVAMGRWIQATAQFNLKIPNPPSLRLKPSFLEYPVTLRTATSDPFVYRQIMIENEYSPVLGLPVHTIIDLGANIGLSSAWFLNRLPGSTVFALEADRENWEACQKNLQPYPDRAVVINAAAWSSTMELQLHRRNCAADNVVREGGLEDGHPSVQGLDMPTVIERSGFKSVDLLKIDIEGAEEQIFGCGVDGWLPLVHNLCIEIHGESCRRAFFSALSGYSFTHLRSGELDICLNISKSPGHSPIH